jgi:pimeloyl-ACP methyl ester carboxylesterase
MNITMKYFNSNIKWWKSFAKLVLAINIIILSNLITCSYPSDIHNNPDKIKEAFEKNNVSPIYEKCNYNQKIIAYTETRQLPPNSNKTILVFIHGSPGSWDNFLFFLKNTELLKQTSMMSFDRLGYGRSNPGEPEVSLYNHAHAIGDCLNSKHPNSHWILVGHSYGGPVASKIAMDFPKETKHLVLVAASIDPQLEKKEWFNYVAEWLVIQWILPQELITSNVEILELKNELETIQPDWHKIKSPTTIVHGEKDTLVPFANVKFAKAHLVNSKIAYILNPEWNHFIPWNQKEILLKALDKILQN